MSLSPKFRLLAVALAALCLTAPISATWSILVVNTRTREVCAASATCIRVFVDWATFAEDHRSEDGGFQPVRLLVVTASRRCCPSSHESPTDPVELTLDRLRLCERSGCCTSARPRVSSLCP